MVYARKVAIQIPANIKTEIKVLFRVQSKFAVIQLILLCTLLDILSRLTELMK